MSKQTSNLDYDPKRFGLSYDPPQIIIEYQKPSSGKLYHHKINCYSFTESSKILEIVDEIYKKHKSYWNHKRISKAQIIQLVEKLRERRRIFEESKKSNESNEYNNIEEDLNIVSKEELDMKKKEMDKIYEKNKIEYGDKNFQYDIRKDFNNNQYAAEWDEDSN